jgi:allophanate hydrolase
VQTVWISRAPTDLPASGALNGLRFGVKDNIDVAGLPTTAACPAFAYTPRETAPVVSRLTAAGALVAGKTNMDQFATGLVGTRTPYGACSSVFDERYISGGSSSGSAVAVALGEADFALGTDTAGSGRVPAAFNGLVGLKPTRGLLSTRGVVPACRSLDCVSIFTRTVDLARRVFDVARGFDAADPFARLPAPGDGAAPWLGGPFRYGVPSPSQLEFFGDDEAATLFSRAIQRLATIGGEQVEIDLAVLRRAADLLYSGPWVAERMAAVRDFFGAHADEMDPIVRRIIGGAERFSAVDTFTAQYQLQALRRAADEMWTTVDVVLLPTTPTIYTHAQIAADPIGLNTNLGYYTNFVNLLDMAAVAAPAGVRPSGLPFGVQLIGPAFSDDALLGLVEQYLGEPVALAPTGCVQVAVVGAHLSGQPLNHQLTDRGARLLRTTRTTADYRLFALPDGRPGLLRDASSSGQGIEIEVWALPEHYFGSFVAAIPPPLGIGTLVLQDGQHVKGFVCESFAVASANEITHLGGWRAYLASTTASRPQSPR